MKRFLNTMMPMCILILLAGGGSVYGDSKQAVEEASKSGKFLFLVFYKDKDAVLGTMEKTAVDFKSKSEKPFTIYKADVSDPAEKEFAAKYVANTPLPLLLVFAPNGAITAGYSKTITAEQLKQSLNISGLVLKLLKPLQEQKVVIAALQTGATRFNKESSKAVADFASDPQYKDFVGVIKADPGATDSAEFLKQCGLDKKIIDATVVVLLPPGKIGKVLTGKITKEDILQALQSCSSGSGCCSDRRFKENITPIDSALEKVLQLQGVSFTWNNIAFPGRNFPVGREIGFIAQDVEPIIPEVVHTDFEGYKSIAYDKLAAVLIEAVKEMKIHMDEQDMLIEELKLKIKELDVKK